MLIGIITATYIPDWLRLHAKEAVLESELKRAVSLAESRGIEESICLSTLQEDKELLRTAFVSYLTRVETTNEIQDSGKKKKSKPPEPQEEKDEEE